MNSVQNICDLIKSGNLTLEDQIQFAKMTPPTPDLQINDGSKTKQKRTFRRTLYELAEWLCGCDIANKFFCYVCLVADRKSFPHSAKDTPFAKVGFADLKNIYRAVDRHRVSNIHLISSLHYSKLAKTEVSDPLSNNNLRSTGEKLIVQQHRHVLNKMIDAIKFCRIFHFVTGDKNEVSGCRDLFNYDFSNIINDVLNEHISSVSDSVFSNPVLSIQDDLLDSFYEVCRNLIKTEIKTAHFVSIQVDELTEGSIFKRFVVIVRYELQGHLFERFVGFIKPASHTVECLSDLILAELRSLNIDEAPKKLMSQSYNGGDIFSKQDGVQSKIKSIYSDAHSIHSYSHTLTSIIQRSASQDKQIKIFFANIKEFSTFFQIPEILNILDTVHKKYSQEHIKWNFKTFCLKFLHKYKRYIGECLEAILELEVEALIISRAISLKHILNDIDFNFWLDFFNKVMPLCRQLQRDMRNAEGLNTCMNIEQLITKFKVNMMDLEKWVQWMEDTAVPTKRQKLNNYVQNDQTQELCDNEIDIKEEITIEEHNITVKSDKEPTCLVNNVAQENLIEVGDNWQECRNKLKANNLCLNIKNSVVYRFTSNVEMACACLFAPPLFKKHQTTFPSTELNIVASYYKLEKGGFGLKNELQALYNNLYVSDETVTTVLGLLKYFYEYNLTHTFSHSSKLLRIICTVPVMTSEQDRCLGTVARVEKFLKSTTAKEKQLNALAMCSIENSLIHTTLNFNDLVIAHFSRKKGLQDSFMYKGDC